MKAMNKFQNCGSKTLGFIFGFLTYAIIVFSLTGFSNQQTHPTINGAIIDTFMKRVAAHVNGPKKLERVVFDWNGESTFKGKALTNLGFFPGTTSESEESKTPRGWIEHGGMSADEPEIMAALRHFYDPKAITGVHYLTDRGTYWEAPVNNYKFNPKIDAITWGLEHKDNPYTWETAINSVSNALETPNKDERDELMALAYRSLGETLHLIGDMGCPPHVRNDSHAAPIGYKWRHLLGDADPMEELTNDIPIKKIFADKTVKQDDNLIKEFSNMKTTRQITESFATWTNENFFSNDTIVGMGVKYHNPRIRPGRPYKSPELRDSNYDLLDFSFKVKFPNGTAILARDLHYNPSQMRNVPYIDRKAVESQLKILLPNIAGVGAQVIKLFVPDLNVEVSKSEAEGDTTGNITHTTDDVYTNQILYNGPVVITSGGKVITVQANQGQFNLENSPFQSGDSVMATISYGAIHVHSEPIKVDGGEPTNTSATNTYSGFIERSYGASSPASYYFDFDVTLAGTVFGNNPNVEFIERENDSVTEFVINFNSFDRNEMKVVLDTNFNPKNKTWVVNSGMTKLTYTMISDVYFKEGQNHSLSLNINNDRLEVVQSQRQPCVNPPSPSNPSLGTIPMIAKAMVRVEEVREEEGGSTTKTEFEHNFGLIEMRLKSPNCSN